MTSSLKFDGVPIAALRAIEPATKRSLAWIAGVTPAEVQITGSARAGLGSARAVGRLVIY